MFNIFSKKQPKNNQFIINQLVDTISSYELKNKELIIENKKLKSNNKELKKYKITELEYKINELKKYNNHLEKYINKLEVKNNKVIVSKKIEIYNQFNINKNIFAKKYINIIEFNRLLLITYITLFELNNKNEYYSLDYENNYQHIFTINNNDISGKQLCIELYTDFINLLANYKFVKIFIIEDNNIIVNNLYDMIIKVIKYIEVYTNNCINYILKQIIIIDENNKLDIHSDPEIINNDIINKRIKLLSPNYEIIYNNYENRNNNNNNNNIFIQREYFIKILNSLNKLTLPYNKINEDNSILDFKYSELYELYNNLI